MNEISFLPTFFFKKIKWTKTCPFNLPAYGGIPLIEMFLTTCLPHLENVTIFVSTFVFSSIQDEESSLDWLDGRSATTLLNNEHTYHWIRPTFFLTDWRHLPHILLMYRVFQNVIVQWTCKWVTSFNTVQFSHFQIEGISLTLYTWFVFFQMVYALENFKGEQLNIHT